MSDHEDEYPLSAERYAEVLASADEPTRKLTLHVMAEHRPMREGFYVMKRLWKLTKWIGPTLFAGGGFVLGGLIRWAS